MVVEHWTSRVLVACIGIRRTELTIVDGALGVNTIQHQSRRSFRQLPYSSRSHFGTRKTFVQHETTPSPSKMTTVLGIWCAFTR